MYETLDEVTEDFEVKALDIVLWPAEALRATAINVAEEEFNDELKAFVKNMFYTMRINNGIGLAAPQVGVSKRVIVMMLDKPLILINPILVAVEGEQVFEEGCLSLPETFAEVKRAAKIRVAYQDEEGTNRELVADGLGAVCIQHEIDHLNGKVFIDHLSTLKRTRVGRRARKIKDKILKAKALANKED